MLSWRWWQHYGHGNCLVKNNEKKYFVIYSPTIFSSTKQAWIKRTNIVRVENSSNSIYRIGVKWSYQYFSIPFREVVSLCKNGFQQAAFLCSIVRLFLVVSTCVNGNSMRRIFSFISKTPSRSREQIRKMALIRVCPFHNVHATLRCHRLAKQSCNLITNKSLMKQK